MFGSTGHESPFDALNGDGDDGESSVDSRAERAQKESRRLGLLEDNEFGWLKTRGNTKGWHGETNYSVPTKASNRIHVSRLAFLSLNNYCKQYQIPAYDTGVLTASHPISVFAV